MRKVMTKAEKAEYDRLEESIGRLRAQATKYDRMLRDPYCDTPYRQEVVNSRMQECEKAIRGLVTMQFDLMADWEAIFADEAETARMYLGMADIYCRERNR